jgi:elongation factor 1-beta
LSFFLSFFLSFWCTHHQFDVTTPKGLAAFNGFMSSKSYVVGYQFSDADKDEFAKFTSCPSSDQYPHAFRWYAHVAALQGILGIVLPTAAKKEVVAVAPPPPTAAAANKVEDEDDFDVFGDEEEEEDKPKKKEEEKGEGGESRAEMLARLKAEAVARTVAKEAKQRTLVAIEVKPWSTEQDLVALFKKITTEVAQDGLKWGEGFSTPEVAFGIKKLCMTFTMGVNNSSDDVQEAIEAMEDEVQSVEITSMNVL